MNYSSCVLEQVLNETTLYSILRSNSSFSLDQPFSPSLQEWIIYLPYSKTKIFLIPPIICLMAALLVIPSILFVIFSRVTIRQETRYLLLGNALLCDLIYLILYTLIAVFSVSDLKLSQVACVTLLFLLAMTYCGGLFTAAAMVLDTYLAILWPLHYISILPSSRTRRLILFLWISSGIFPATVLLILKITQNLSACPTESCSIPLILVMTLQGDNAVKCCYVLSISALFLCLSLILSCYMVLFFKTKQSGIWKSVFSRASVTFLMHHVILFFHFSPLVAFVVEFLLYVNAVIGPETGICISMIICNVLLILPKALSPYLCGLRYREISSSLKLFLRWKRMTVVSPSST